MPTYGSLSFLTWLMSRLYGNQQEARYNVTHFLPLSPSCWGHEWLSTKSHPRYLWHTVGPWDNIHNADQLCMLPCPSICRPLPVEFPPDQEYSRSFLYTPHNPKQTSFSIQQRSSQLPKHWQCKKVRTEKDLKCICQLEHKLLHSPTVPSFHLIPILKALTQEKESRFDCSSLHARISQFWNIFDYSVVNHSQSSGSIRPMSNSKLPQYCPGNTDSHVGWECTDNWCGAFFLSKYIGNKRNYLQPDCGQLYYYPMPGSNKPHC